VNLSTQGWAAELPHAFSMASMNSLNAGKYRKDDPLGCSSTQHPSNAVVTKRSNIVLRYHNADATFAVDIEKLL